MSYTRVLPRDLFNEAKLLKCLGQLSLLMHDNDGVIQGHALKMTKEGPAGFEIEQDAGSGDLYCSNLTFWLNGRQLGLRCCYNSRSPYPLVLLSQWDEDRDEFPVFDDSGALSQEFVAWLDSRAGVVKA